jgi:hypothetical protein
MESIAAETGVIDTSCHVPADERKSYNGVSEDSAPIEFRIYTSAAGSKVTVKVTVTVEWTVKGETEKLESTKIILTKNDD